MSERLPHSSRAQLTLSSLKLACSILRRGGSFLTKVFRSKDYPSLLPVFEQLFKKVHVTKPQASRNESAEIFVFCDHFRAPEKIDPDLLDPRIVFKDIATEAVPELTVSKILHDKSGGKKKHAKAVGYDDDLTQFGKVSAREFLMGDSLVNILSKCTELTFDDDEIKSHALTTPEIRQYCEDIKVLGTRELRLLLKWRRDMKSWFYNEAKKLAEESIVSEDLLTSEPDEETDAATEMVEIDALDEEAEALKQQELQARKRLRKKEMKEKRKLRDRIQMKMIIPGDKFDVPESDELFSLSNIKGVKSKQTKPTVESTRVNSASIATTTLDSVGNVPSADKPEVTAGDIDSDSDADEDIRLAQKVFKIKENKNVLIVEKRKPSEMAKLSSHADKQTDIAGMEEASTSGKSAAKEDKSTTGSAGGPTSFSSLEQDNEDEPASKAKRIKLDPYALAVAEQLKDSKKKRRDIIEWGYNRYAFNDDNLPEWFVEDEKKHSRKRLPVTKEQVEYYRQLQKDIDARPIKKVAEAKARKKKVAMKRMEKAKKKTNLIAANEELTEKEKAHEMRRIYRATSKALNKKPETTYVVAKKGQMGKRAIRPSGLKGRYKVVDPRMKTDARGEKAKMKRKNKGKPPSRKRK